MHHQLGHIAGRGQVRARLDRHTAVATQQVAHRRAHVRRLQGLAQIVHRHARACHALRIDVHQGGAVRAAQGHYIAGAGHALDVGFHAVRHALQVKVTHIGRGAVQGHADDGHIVNPFGFDQGLEHAQAAGQPVGVFADRVVQPDQGFCARHAHFELHRQDRDPGA